MLAEKIRRHARQRYVLPALNRKAKRFTIRAGDVEHELEIAARTPAICSALRTGKFLKQNNLRLVETSGPQSGQSTTVVFTYEFVEAKPASATPDDSWKRLRGMLKNVFAEAGGGEAYLRSERKNFYDPPQNK